MLKWLGREPVNQNQMTTIADLNYVLGILNANEEEWNRHLSAFECCADEKERYELINSLTNRSKMTENLDKSAQGVNKGTAATVKATKAAVELAQAEGVSLATVAPNAEGKIGVEEVKAATNVK